MNKQKVQLGVTLPFSYYLDRDAASATPLLRFPSPNMIRQYVQALIREIALWEDVRDEVAISALRFTCGYLHLIKPDGLKELLETLHRVFDIEPGCEITALSCPGPYLDAHADILKAYGIKLILDIPTFCQKEAQECMLPYGPGINSLSFADMRDSVLGVRTFQRTDVRSDQMLEEHIQKLLSLRPPRIEVTGFHADDCGMSGSDVLRPRLLAAGYREVERNTYAIDGGDLRYRADISSSEAFIGLGLNALTRFDGTLTRNTDDFKRYLQVSCDPAQLYVRQETDAQ